MPLIKKNTKSKATLVDFLRRNSTHEGANPQKRPPPWPKPNVRPSGMAILSRAATADQPHRDGLFDAAYKGFYSNTKTG